jgi:hypothetical protein
MASECFRVRVVAIEDRTVVTDWLSLPAGGLDAVAATRSAALLVLYEADRSGKSKLRRALDAEPKDWLVTEAWHRANVGRFIERTKLVARTNADVNLADVWEAAARNAKKQLAAAWQKAHRYRLEIVVTEPAWASHLKKGAEIGSMAYDVWPTDDAVSRAAPASQPQPQPSAVGWTKLTRAKVHGSRVPHPLDPEVPKPAQDWKTIATALGSYGVSGGKGADVAKRAIDVGDLPKKLDAAVERMRLALVKMPGETKDIPAVPALLRTWARVGGPAFVWEVLSAPSAEVEISLPTKRGTTPGGPRRFVPKDLVLRSCADQLWGTVRRIAFALGDAEWKSFRSAASPVLKKYPESRVLVYANGRDPSLAADRAARELRDAKKAPDPWAAGTAEILASLHDPALALEYATHLGPNYLGKAAFDVVEMLGCAAAGVIEVYQAKKDPDRSDRHAVDALALANALAAS